MEFDDILKTLPKLSNDQLNELVMKCKGLLGSGLAEVLRPTADESKEAFMIDCLIAACGAYGLGEPPRFLITRSPDYKTFKDKLPQIEQFLAPSNLSPGEKKLVMLIGFEEVMKSLKQRRVPATPRQLMLNVHMIPALLELGVPRMARNGLLRILTHRTKWKAPKS